MIALIIKLSQAQGTVMVRKDCVASSEHPCLMNLQPFRDYISFTSRKGANWGYFQFKDKKGEFMKLPCLTCYLDLTLAKLPAAQVTLFLTMAQWNQHMEKASTGSREWTAQISNQGKLMSARETTVKTGKQGFRRDTAARCQQIIDVIRKIFPAAVKDLDVAI